MTSSFGEYEMLNGGIFEINCFGKRQVFSQDISLSKVYFIKESGRRKIRTEIHR